jgi:signal transduction histidine kinase
MVEMQAMLSQLRPEPLATTGLVEALREQCEALGYRSGIPVHFEIGDLPPDSHLWASTRENLFRIAQEALTNVVRHADASHVTVALGREGEVATLAVCDDGRGFDPADQAISARRLGLVSMRERAVDLGGSLVVESSPGAGTAVRARVPAG